MCFRKLKQHRNKALRPRTGKLTCEHLESTSHTLTSKGLVMTGAEA